VERAREKLMEEERESKDRESKVSRPSKFFLEGLQTLDSLSFWKSRAWKTEVSSNCHQIFA
jgi:hypothetical protein